MRGRLLVLCGALCSAVNGGGGLGCGGRVRSEVPAFLACVGPQGGFVFCVSDPLKNPHPGGS